MALTDLIRPSIVELGKIKIGRKGAERTSQRGNSFRMPEKLDHFIITTMQKDGAGDFLPDVSLMQSLGNYADADGKLRRLPVAVLSDDLDEIMQCEWFAYQGSRMAARSDGVTLTKFYDTKTNSWLKEPQSLPWESHYANIEVKGSRLFKKHLTLNVVIRAAEGSRWGGVYRFRTTSEISQSRLLGSFQQIRGLTSGVLQGLPLQLVLNPQRVNPDGKATVVYVVQMELLGSDLMQIQQQALDRMRYQVEHRKQVEAARLEYRALLAAPISEDEDAHIVEEFHPEQVAGVPVESSRQEAAVDPLATQLGIVGEPQQPDLVAKIRWYLSTYDMTDIESDELFKAGLSAQKVEDLSPAEQEKFWEYLNRDMNPTE